MNEGADSREDGQLADRNSDSGAPLDSSLHSDAGSQDSVRPVATSVKQFILDMLGSSNNVSMTRVMSVMILTNVMAVWTATCLKKWEIVDIPWGVVTMAAIVITGKAVQKFAER